MNRKLHLWLGSLIFLGLVGTAPAFGQGGMKGGKCMQGNMSPGMMGGGMQMMSPGMMGGMAGGKQMMQSGMQNQFMPMAGMQKNMMQAGGFQNPMMQMGSMQNSMAKGFGPQNMMMNNSAALQYQYLMMQNAAAQGGFNPFAPQSTYLMGGGQNPALKMGMQNGSYRPYSK